MQVIEWFCGIGGFTSAFPDRPTIAIDVNQNALSTYRLNHIGPAANPNHQIICANITSLSFQDYGLDEPHGWWLSPPCQPFTLRGKRRDHQDQRTKPLLRLIGQVNDLRPAWIAMENVPGFDGSVTHGMLLETLARNQYHVQQHLLCPTQFGFPNRRKRFFLLASRTKDVDKYALKSVLMKPISDFLDDSVERELYVDNELLNRYQGAIHVIDTDDEDAIANCFTSAYGTSPVRSGSYLRDSLGVRRFSPTEILRLLGFGDRIEFPESLSLEQRWRLVGNSVHVAIVRDLLTSSNFLAE